VTSGPLAVSSKLSESLFSQVASLPIPIFAMSFWVAVAA